MNANRENILVAAAVGTAGEYVYDLNGEGDASLNPVFNEGDILFIDPRSNRTIAPGATSSEVPRLKIAQAVDPDNVGYPTQLREVAGGYIDVNGLTNVTTEPASTGCNNVMDFYTSCTFYEDNYGITIAYRGDRTLDWYKHHNNWEKETFSVALKDYQCDTCESGVDSTEVMCALIDKINAHKRPRNDAKEGAFRRKSLKQQAKVRQWEAYPIFENDYTYDITVTANAFPAITGVKIDGVDYPFTGTVDAGATTTSLVSQIDKIINLTNKAFKTAGIRGYAVRLDQIVGTGRPNDADFTILMNSCVAAQFLDDAGDAIVVAAVNPFTAITKDPYCEGCNSGTSWTPDSGVRVVAKGLPIVCDPCQPVDRKAWYHSEVDIYVPEDYSKYVRFYKKEIQKSKAPQGLGVMWAKRILDASSGGTGFNYDNWVNDLAGLYYHQRKGTAFTESNQGLDCKGLYNSIMFKQLLRFRETSNMSANKGADLRSFIVIENNNTGAYTDIKAVLDPWLASAGFPAIVLTSDVDQVEATDYANGTADAGTGNDTGEGAGSSQS